ncbi:MAG: hypothetical protein QM715_21345 [Nibricoccus sp.]
MKSAVRSIVAQVMLVAWVVSLAFAGQLAHASPDGLPPPAAGDERDWLLKVTVRDYGEGEETVSFAPQAAKRKHFVATVEISDPVNMNGKLLRIFSYQSFPEAHPLTQISTSWSLLVKQSYLHEQLGIGGLRRRLYLNDLRMLSEEEEKKAAEPGATDNPGDAQ